MKDPQLFSYLHNSPFLFNYNWKDRAQLEHKILFNVESKLTNNFTLVKLQTKGSQTKCGKFFSKDDLIYSCRDCAMDATCVLCSKCFFASDHDGHSTSFRTSPGGGCCDCGDNEAWKVPINCKLHLDSQTPRSNIEHQRNYLDSLPSDLIDSMRSTIYTVLDFIVSTLATSPLSHSTPRSEKDIESGDLEYDEMEDNYLKGRKCPYCVILWNDEVHSFQEVISQVTLATRCTEEEAKRIAESVDLYGRDIIATSTSIPELLSIAKKIDEIRLIVTIRSCSGVFREIVAGILLKWLQELPSKLLQYELKDYLLEANILSFACRQIICEELMEMPSYYQNLQQLHCSVFSRDDEILKIEEEEWRQSKDLIVNTGVQEESENFHIANASPFLRRCIVDHLLLFDCKLWKVSRHDLRQLFVNTCLVGDDEYKKKLAVQFTLNFFRIVDFLLNYDKEFDSSLVDFSVQLYTPPSIAEYLITNTPIFYILCNLLRTIYLTEIMSDTFSMSKLGFSYLAAKERVGFHYPKLHCEGEACKSKKVVLIPQALKHLLCGKKLKEEGFRFGLSSGDMRIKKDIVAFLDLLKVWQGMNPIKRELRNHIEFESENWLNSFSIVLQTKDLRSQFAECFAPTENLENDIITLKEVVSLTIECLDQWCSAEQAEENKELNIEKYQNVEFIPKSECFIGKFKVSSQLVSFLHPLSWFLAHLLTFVPKLNFPANNPDSKDFLQKLFVFKSLDLVKENISDDNRILRLIEPCIRVNSLIAQIKCGLWVRNGFSVRNQALHYKEGSLRDCMDNDIFMLQIGACLVEPNKFLITLIDRFELLNWLSGITQVKVPPSELQFPTLIPHLSVDSMQWVSLAEEFLQLLIIILTERTRLCGESFEAELFREVIHHLATQTNGMAFSELNKRIAVRLNDFGDSNVSEATLEKVLNKVAKFKFPEGIADFGLYELKDEYYSQIDCWFWHYTRNQREEIEAILAKKGIKNNMSLPFYDTDGISITLPSIKPLSANFLSLNKIILSKTFIKILLVSLWNVTRTVTEQNQQFPPVRNDAVVSSMLHLLFCSIVIGKEEFLKLCVTQKVQIFPTPYTKQKETDEGLTVMELILELLECSEEETFLKDFIVRLKVLVNEFERTESGLLIITEWKAKIREKFGLKEGNYVTEKDKILKKKNQSKADAKQRRLKVMDQFNSQQKQFKTNFESDLNNVDSLYVPKPATNLNTLITEKSWDFPEGTCIVCQEGASGDGEHLYGMLALIQPSMIQRNLNFSSKESVEEALNVPPSLDTNLNHSVDEEVTNIKYPPTFTNTPGLQATSCGHLMHFHCFKNYTGSLVIRHQAQLTRNHPENLDRKEFMCPLCKSLGNCLLPILWSEKKETLNWCLNNDKNSEEESFFSFANYWNTNLKAKIKKQIEKNNFEEDVEMGESTRTEHSVFQSFHDNSCKLISGLNNALELHYTTDTDITSTTNFTEPAIPGRFPSDRNSVSLKVSEIQRYSKLLETVMTLAYHHINQGYEHEDFGLKLLDLLWETFFYTISCVEILSRGVIGNSVDILGSTKAEANGFVYTGVLENSSEQNLTLLRVLSETIMTQSTFATQDAKVEEQLLLRVSEFFKSLFFGLIDPKSAPEFINELSNNNGEDLNNPLLTEDTIFSLLVECTMSALPVLGIVEFAEVQKFIGILWALEIVKCLVGVIESVGVMHDNWCSDPKFSSFNFPTQANVSDRKGKKLVSDNMGINDGAEDSEIKSFFSWLMISLGMKPDVIQYTKKMVTSSVLLTLTKAVCLPFLRKTCLLVHAKFGVIAPGLDESTTSLKADLGLENEALGDVADEYTRLCRYLNLPLVESVCSNKTMNDETLSKLISGWCVHLSQYDLSHFYHAKVPMDVNFKEIDEDKERLLTLALPSIYSLVNLPNRLDILFEESKKQICKRCLNIPQNPAVCLLCGLIVCHQSFCCQEGDDGECNLHCNSCGGTIGIFFIVKKCIILFLSYGNGCLLDAPYLDSHGEVDIGLRRGRPLYLNAKRYNEIRKLWLSHSIPSHIARKIEQSFDTGGWITM